VGVTVRISGPGLLTRVWDRASSLQLGAALVAKITRRAFDQGLSTADQPHAPYSTRYLAKRVASGRSGRVDLTWTGAMRRSLRLKRPTATGFLIGLTGDPATYGSFVDDLRPWLGLSPADAAYAQTVVARILTALVAKGAGAKSTSTTAGRQRDSRGRFVKVAK